MNGSIGNKFLSTKYTDWLCTPSEYRVHILNRYVWMKKLSRRVIEVPILCCTKLCRWLQRGVFLQVHGDLEKIRDEGKVFLLELYEKKKKIEWVN